MQSPAGDISEARKTILGLVDRYARNRDRYASSSYNEETCRAEFITPLFEALGWDVTNKAGDAEQYRDVIHEEGIKVGDFTKAPDYTFRIGGARKFFVEAKNTTLLALKSEVSKAKSPHDQTQLERRVDATEESIDRLVYELFGLSADETKVVESADPA